METMETMKAGDKIYVEQCPRDNGSCDYSGEFERVADGSYWFACPKCGWAALGIWYNENK